MKGLFHKLTSLTISASLRDDPENSQFQLWAASHNENPTSTRRLPQSPDGPGYSGSLAAAAVPKVMFLQVWS